MPKNLSLFNYHTNIFLLMNIFFSEWNLKNGPGTNSRRFPPKLRIKIHTPGNHYVHPPTCKIMINDNISLISIWQGNLKKKKYNISDATKNRSTATFKVKYPILPEIKYPHEESISYASPDKLRSTRL